MKIKVRIYKIIRVTAGGFHSWCETNIGRMKKENKNIPEEVWSSFRGKQSQKISKSKWSIKLWKRIMRFFRINFCYTCGKCIWWSKGRLRYVEDTKSDGFIAPACEECIFNAEAKQMIF